MAVGVKSNVMLLDAITGIQKSALSGHTSTISSLAFSLDGTLLISGSDDKTAKLWDVQTGGVIRTFGDKTLVVSAASISPDGFTIALGTSSGEIRLWNIRTEEYHSFEAGHNRRVTNIVFSPVNSRHLLSSSLDKTVRQWGTDGHQIGTSYLQKDRVNGLAYSMDGTRFVSCGERVVTIRDSESGEVVVKLNGPDGTTLYRCCFSPDGRFVACAAGESICVWDITTSGAPLVGCLTGHSSSVTFTAFPSSLISGSLDQSVKFWQSSSFSAESMTTDDMTAWGGSASIVSAKLFAEDGVVVTCDSSGVVKTWDLMTGTCKLSSSAPVKGQLDTHLAGETLILVWYSDISGEYHIWDVYKGQLLRKVDDPLPSPDLGGLKISGDGTKIFRQGPRSVRAVSMQTGEDAGRVQHGSEGAYPFFVHGSQVRIEYSRGRGWDFGGPTVSGLREFADRPRLDLVEPPPGGKIKPRWIEDIVTKTPVFFLPGRYTGVHAQIEWDGRYLLVWSLSGQDIVVMDFDRVCPR